MPPSRHSPSPGHGGAPAYSLRVRATAAAMRATATLARRAGRGGSVLGGHLGLRLDRNLLAELARGRRIVTVSATNGKTTTNGLLAAALATAGPLLTNRTGSNLVTGLVTTLASDLSVHRASLEVDEATLAVTAGRLAPATMVLGNLSRDQLDRHGAVRSVADRWRTMLDALTQQGRGPHLVANADDPMITYVVGAHTPVTWVAAHGAWTADALVCPRCDAGIEHRPPDWRCTGCDLARPVPDVEPTDSAVVFHDQDGRVVPLRLDLPGAFNRGNAALALAAARAEGIDPSVAAPAMAHTSGMGGRYQTVTVDGRRVRMLMAKNPAGWQASLDILAEPPTPVVLAVNARVGDGRDTSWLWDVPLERLRGRRVVAAGERAHDLAVRLHYAEVDHLVQVGPALDAIGMLPVGEVELIANYTAFSDATVDR